MRLIAAIRLSRLVDETTSVETQRRSLEAYAQAHRHKILAVTEDLDVSGGVPIRLRNGVGPWLAADRLDQWDAIAGYRLDRLFRDHYDFVTFYHDVCQRHGKAIISVSEGIDMSTPTGRMIAGILVQFAEWERARASERRRDATANLRRAAYWHGGTPTFGYRPQPSGDHVVLVPDPDQAAMVRDWAVTAIAGKSISALAEEITAQGVSTPYKAPRWSPTTLLRLLRNPALRGYVTHQGKIVRGEDGLPLRRESILDDDIWHALQARLEIQPTGRKQSHGPSLLAGVVWCGPCSTDRRMYVNRYTSRRPGRRETEINDYRCPRQLGGCGQSVSADRLDFEVAALLLNAYGTEDVPEPRPIPAVDHSTRLADIDKLLAELDQDHAAGLVTTRTYGRQSANLEAERARLEAEPAAPARVDYVLSGTPFAVEWERRDTEGRNALLRKLGARVVYGGGFLVANLRTLDDLRRAIRG